MANVSLLRRTLQYIKRHPKEHDQSMWFIHTDCGTTACFAGTAARLSGYKPYWLSWDGTQRRTTHWAVAKDSEDPRAENIRVEILARQLLELSEEDADRLFYQDNTVRELEDIVDEIISADATSGGAS